MGDELEEQVHNVHQQEDLRSQLCWRTGTSGLTTLVPRLILRDCLSAKSLSLNDAWNAVCDVSMRLALETRN